MPKARGFKAGRMQMHPTDQVQGSGPATCDDSLTSLDWLQNFSMQVQNMDRSSTPGCPPSLDQHSHKSLGTNSPSGPVARDTAATRMPQYLCRDSTSCPLFSRYPHIQMQPIPLVEVDYKTNPKAKPPHSYASLICMAIQASKQPKVTLSTIYEWIQGNFCYYRHAKPTWQNSIRHTLSLNKCFKKIPRRKDEPGKGGFWQINPEHSDIFVNEIFKRKTLPANHYQTLLRKPATTSVNEGVQKPMSSTDNRRTMSSTETPLHLDFLAATSNGVLGKNCSPLEDLDLTTAVRAMKCDMERMQQPTEELARCWGGGGGGDVMNHQLSYGYIVQCDTTMNGTGNLAELQMPLQYQHQHHHQDQQHLVHLDESLVIFSEQPGVGEVQSWAEVKVATETFPNPGSRLWSE